jgi:hypothetical protein
LTSIRDEISVRDHQHDVEAFRLGAWDDHEDFATRPWPSNIFAAIDLQSANSNTKKLIVSPNLEADCICWNDENHSISHELHR